jgi:hypothetical protein
MEWPDPICHDYGTEKGYLRLECLGRENGSPIDRHRMVPRTFSSPSVMISLHSIGVAAHVGRSVLLKVKRAKCTEKDPALTASFR